MLEVASYSKPSNRKVPLHSSSAHHPSVHAWPMARMLHFERVISSYNQSIFAKAKFITDFVNKAAGHSNLPALFNHLAGVPPEVRPGQPIGSWLVVPFNVAFERSGMATVVEDFREEWPARFSNFGSENILEHD